MLIRSAIMGWLKTWTYVAWVAVFSTLAGLVYGAWIDGASLALISLYLLLSLACLALLLWIASRFSHDTAPVSAWITEALTST